VLLEDSSVHKELLLHASHSGQCAANPSNTCSDAKLVCFCSVAACSPPLLHAMAVLGLLLRITWDDG
jgi:hypothetical protein